MLKLVSIFGIIALFGDAYCRPQLRAEDLEPFLDNPQALEEFGEILAAEIRLDDLVWPDGKVHRIIHSIKKLYAFIAFCSFLPCLFSLL